MNNQTMNNQEEETNKELLINLQKATSESEALSFLEENNFILPEKGGNEGVYKGNSFKWEFYGNDEGNIASVTSNSKVAVKAFSELLTNSQDAMILKGLSDLGIDPASSDAPQSPKDAVELLFKIPNGDYSEYKSPSKGYKDLEKNILVLPENSSSSAEGPNPTIVVLDKGIGISNANIKDTILSNTRSNKINSPCLAGSFSAGFLAVCNFQEHGMRLIITKPCPSSVDKGEEHADHVSFTIMLKIKPTLLRQWFGKVYKQAAIMHLTIEGKIPHFSSEFIDNDPMIRYDITDSKESVSKYEARDKKPPSAKVLRQSFEGFDKMEHGTVIKLWDYQINEGVKDLNVSFGNVKDPMRLQKVLDVSIPEVTFPICVRAPYFISKMENNPGMILGFRSYLEQNKWLKGVDEGKSQNFFCAPSEITIASTSADDWDGSILVKIYPLKGGKRSSIAMSVRGSFWNLNSQQWQKMRPHTDFATRWVLGTAMQERLVVITDLSRLSEDTKAEFADVSREGFRGRGIFGQVEAKVIEAVSNDTTVKKLKEHIKNEMAEKCLMNDIKDSPLYKIFKTGAPKRATKKSKSGSGQCLDTGGLLGPCDKTPYDVSHLNSILSQASLIDSKFKQYLDDAGNPSGRRKEVSLSNSAFHLQIGTDADQSFFDDHFPEISCFSSQDGVTWSEHLLNSRNANNGIITLGLASLPELDALEHFHLKIELEPADADKCDHKSFNFTLECQNVKNSSNPSSSTSRNRSSVKKGSKSTGTELAVEYIKKEEVSNYMTFVGKGTDFGSSQREMLEDDLVGFRTIGDDRNWAVNIDSRPYKLYVRGLRNAGGVESEEVQDKFVKEIIYIRIEHYETWLQQNPKHEFVSTHSFSQSVPFDTTISRHFYARLHSTSTAAKKA